MTILRHTDVITTAMLRLKWLAGGLLWLVASTTAAADWRGDALDTLVRESGDHRLVVLGEMHGTREIPVLAGDLVEHWSTASPLLLALESGCSCDCLEGSPANGISTERRHIRDILPEWRCSRW